MIELPLVRITCLLLAGILVFTVAKSKENDSKVPLIPELIRQSKLNFDVF
jgi:hypothetical protein